MKFIICLANKYVTDQLRHRLRQMAPHALSAVSAMSAIMSAMSANAEP